VPHGANPFSSHTPAKPTHYPWPLLSLFSVCLLAGGKVGKLEMWRTGGLEVSIPLMCPFTLSFPYEGGLFFMLAAGLLTGSQPRLQA